MKFYPTKLLVIGDEDLDKLLLFSTVSRFLLMLIEIEEMRRDYVYTTLVLFDVLNLLYPATLAATLIKSFALLCDLREVYHYLR